MKNHLDYSGSHESGFSLIEMMIVSAILLIVTGAIFAHLNNAQQRMTTEQSKVDDFDQARDFVDQFFRDINQIGYPNARMVSFLAPLTLQQAQATPQVAVGLVQIGNNTISFEGDINQSGVVQEVQYVINGSGNCAQCLQRSQIPKVAGPPLTQMQNGAIWGTEVNDVISNPIFTYYDTNGNPINTSPALDIVNNGPVLATVKTIHIALTIQNPNVIDPRTKQPIQTTFEGEVSLNNCSMAAVGVPPMSCQ